MRGLIGYPLGHSYSKIIHESINHKPYDLIELNEEEFNKFMIDKSFECINVTIPYKEKVIPYLDIIDEHAKSIGAINCIINQDNKLIGYNSDYYGFKYMLEHHNIDLKDKVVAILGSGGASKAIYEVVKDLKALKIYITSRNKRSAYVTYDELADINPEILINTTPIGMYPNNDDIIYDISKLNNLKTVIDIIYNPINTKLIIEARNRGIKAIGGLEMLVAQAIKALEFFDDQKYDDNLIENKYLEILKEKMNIVLIGMPSSGKSTISNILKDRLDYHVVEMDEMIKEDIGMSIKEYFSLYGEETFRDKETLCAKSLRNEHHKIISCGGGIILRDINMQYLRENGFIIFIDRDIDKLIATDDRPLSDDYDKLKKLYDERYDLYLKYSDIQIKNNSDINETIDRILESWILK